MIREAYLVDAVRTPRGRQSKPNKGFIGELANVHPVTLGALLVNALLDRNPKVPADKVEDVIYSTATVYKEQATDIARNIVLSSKLPVTTSGVQLNRYCAGALQANAFASASIRVGDLDVAMAGGGEHMNMLPINCDIDYKRLPFPPIMMQQHGLGTQGAAAEIICEKYKLNQDEIDEFSVSSQKKAAAAQAAGKFDREIIPVPYKDAEGKAQLLTKDTHVKADTTVEKLKTLPRPFKPKGGLVHAGNSSGITDGASLALWASEEICKELGLKPRARLLSNANFGVLPKEMLDGVIPGTQLALKRAGLKLEDIDLFEINEAFACVPVAWMKTLGVPQEKVNVNGGAVAMGHPLGCTGGILLANIVNELERRDLKYGLITMCAALGMSGTMVVERL
jgi:acetyl-CoA acetyltransferase family protein